MARTHSQVVADTNREFVNLRRTLRSMQSKGATLTAEQQAIVDMKPSEFKRGTINAQVERQLLGVRKRIGKEAIYVDPETGEAMRWEDYQKERRRASARKGARTKARAKEAKLHLKYINILDSYINHAQADAGAGLTNQKLRPDAIRLFRLQVSNVWKQVKNEALSSEGSLKVLERVIKSAEADIKYCCERVVMSSTWEELEDRSFWLHNVIESISKNFTAFSMDEGQNIMVGGGFGI